MVGPTDKLRALNPRAHGPIPKIAQWPTNQQTDWPTDWRTNQQTAGYRVACMQLKKDIWENPPKFPWHYLCLTSHNSVISYGIYKKLVTVRKILKKSLKWDQSGISSFIRSKVMSKTSRIMTKINDQEDCQYSSWHSLCLSAYISGIFQQIYKKLVTLGKILSRSLKWDQSGISSSFCLKDMSKTRWKLENSMTCTSWW